MGTRASYLSRLQSVRGTIRQLKSIDFAQATSIPLVETRLPDRRRSQPSRHWQPARCSPHARLHL